MVHKDEQGGGSDLIQPGVGKILASMADSVQYRRLNHALLFAG
jgi:hypothetical protein